MDSFHKWVPLDGFDQALQPGRLQLDPGVGEGDPVMLSRDDPHVAAPARVASPASRTR